MTACSHPESGLTADAEESGGDCGSVAQIGNTSIRRIRLLIGGKSRNVYLKLEGDNPGGSIKDRTALSLLRNLEKTGQLSTGVRLVESSSGNLAIGLAMLARDSGYRFTAVVDPMVTAENMARMCRNVQNCIGPSVALRGVAIARMIAVEVSGGVGDRRDYVSARDVGAFYCEFLRFGGLSKTVTTTTTSTDPNAGVFESA